MNNFPTSSPSAIRRRLRRLAVTLTAAGYLGVVACGGRGNVYEVPPATNSHASNPSPAFKAAAPAFIASQAGGIDSSVVRRIEAIPGVAVVTEVRVVELKVASGPARAKLKVAFVDPPGLRSVATASARDAEFVWSSLQSGQAVVGHEAAAHLGAGSTVLTLGGVEVPVGAFADLLEPPLADIVVSRSLAAPVPERDAKEVVAIGARAGTSMRALRRDLTETARSLRLRRMTPASGQTGPPPPEPTAGLLGPMRYEILRGGFIRPDPAWVEANVVAASVPIVGAVQCHRLLVPQLAAALTEIQQRGLAGHITHYDGCFVPRFIGRDPSRPLSMHAFGLAIDLNAASNAFGTKGTMNPDVVAIFEKWGFEWGGRWSEPDPMHFELARIVQR